MMTCKAREEMIQTKKAERQRQSANVNLCRQLPKLEVVDHNRSHLARQEQLRLTRFHVAVFFADEALQGLFECLAIFGSFCEHVGRWRRGNAFSLGADLMSVVQVVTIVDLYRHLCL